MNNENQQNQTHKSNPSLGRRTIDELLALKEEMAGRFEEIIARIEQNYDRRLENAILFLAGSDDGENLEGSIGFNGSDSRFGHWLASQLQGGAMLTLKQAHTALQMMQKYNETQLEPNGYSLPMAWEDIAHQYRERTIEGDPSPTRMVLKRDEEHDTYIAISYTGDTELREHLSECARDEDDTWCEPSGNWDYGYSLRATEALLAAAAAWRERGFDWYVDPDIEAAYYMWQEEQKAGIGSGRISASFSRSATSAESSSNGTVDLMGDTPLEMVYVPQGEFLMGSPETELKREENESPQHSVTVPAFYMGKYPVTQRQWQVVALLDPVDIPLAPRPSKFKGKDRPVEKVTWFEAVEFCKRLSKHTGDHYRLPSEAEWEYACRATQDGTSTPFYFGETISTEQANYAGRHSTYGKGEKGVSREKTTKVGSFPANAFGLHDMHGNVLEWCEDVWHKNYEGAPTDGSAWVTDGTWPGSRILRGGWWSSDPMFCRSARRTGGEPDGYHRDYCGFRVVRSSPNTLLSVDRMGDIPLEMAHTPHGLSLMGSPETGEETEGPRPSELHVTALGNDGRLFHALRTSNGDWNVFNDGSEIPNSADTRVVSSAVVGGELHVCLGKLGGYFFHALRNSDGSWNGCHDCSIIPNYSAFSSCAGIGAELHVCGVSGGRFFRAIRQSNGNWNGFYDSSWIENADSIEVLSCAGVGHELHVCLLKYDGRFFHGLREPDGSWDGFNDGSWIANADNLKVLSCAGVGNELHVCLLKSDGRFFHGLRKPDGSWDGFNDGSAIPNATDISDLSCAGVGNELHVCLLKSDGRFFHGLRKPDGSWNGFNDGFTILTSSGFSAISCGGS